MDLADMLCVGPIYVHRHQGEYRCVWTPMGKERKVEIHGIGRADIPYLAVSRALKDAQEKGWKPEVKAAFVPNNY